MCRCENFMRSWALFTLILAQMRHFVITFFKSQFYFLFLTKQIYREGKGKGKREFVQRLVVNTPLRRSGMVRVLSFTCTPRVHPLTE